MKKLDNEIRAIFTDAGYINYDTRRKRWFKVLCELVESGIKFDVCTKGQHWVKDGVNRGNVKVSGFGWTTRSFLKNTNIGSYDVVRLIGKHLQLPEVKEQVKSYVNLDNSCQRCGGAGFIPQFHYWCDGICFECYGSGYSKKNRTEVQIINS